jgi:hypothetical protein
MEPLNVETVTSPDPTMPMATICVMALLVALTPIFVLLALVKMWGLRMQQKRGGCGGLDVESLRRQRDSGEITQEEFDRILGGITGGGPGAAMRPAKAGSEENPPQPPIENTEDQGS